MVCLCGMVLNCFGLSKTYFLRRIDMWFIIAVPILAWFYSLPSWLGFIIFIGVALFLLGSTLGMLDFIFPDRDDDYY